MSWENNKLTTQKEIDSMLNISEKIYNENAVLRDIRASYETHNSLTDEQIILFKTIVRELKLKAKQYKLNIGAAKVKDSNVELEKTEIMFSVKNLHEFMKKENTIKTTYGGRKDKYIPCTISIKDGFIYIDYNTKRRVSNQHNYKQWDSLTKKERREIKSEKRNPRNRRRGK